MKFATALSVLSLLQSTARAQSSVRGATQRRGLSPTSPCILTLQETQYIDDARDVNKDFDIFFNDTDVEIDGGFVDEQPESWYCELTGDDADATNTTFVKVLGLNESFYEDQKALSGEMALLAPDAMIDGQEMTIPSGAQVQVDEIPSHGDSRRLQSNDKSMLVVRVVASDSQTSANEASIRSEVFEGISLQSQYSKCSKGELNFMPYKGNGITNGVTTVSISNNVKGADNSVIRNAAVAELKTKLGTNKISSKVDHVMLCLPPGTSGGWIAYAYVNSWLSVYNDKWCQSLSTQVHEVGHNLGLPHSGEGSSEYADQSGMMGFSYGQKDEPQMCFNPSKSWKLGWYGKQRATFDSAQKPKAFTLVGVVDYNPNNSDSSKNVLIRISSGNAADFYVGYNRAKSYNSGTKEAQNQVVIIKAESGYKSSVLVGKLGKNGKKTLISNYKNKGVDLIVRYRANTSKGIDEAIVDVYFSDCDPLKGCVDRNPTVAPTPNPTRKPTAIPTKVPTKPPTPQPTPQPLPIPVPDSGSCNSDQALFELKLKTDGFNLDNSWELVRDSTKQVVKSKGSYGKPNKLYTERLCLKSEEDYTFTIFDAWGDSMCCKHGNGFYSAQLNGKEIFAGGEGIGEKESRSFKTSSGSGPCNVNQAELSIEVKTDNFPADVSWKVVNSAGRTIKAKSDFKDAYTRYALEKPVCLPKNKCSTFFIDDSFGDGLTSGKGGEYKLYLDGKTVRTGQDYGKGESKVLCP